MKARSERDKRFLIFVGLVLVAISLGFKSDIVGPTQVWGLGVGLLVLATAALMGYLHSESGGMPSLEHFVPVILGTLAVAGLSALPGMEWWKYSLITGAFGIGFCFAAHLDYNQIRDKIKPGHLVVQEVLLAFGLAGSFLVILTIGLALPVRLAGIFLLALLASYRSFRIFGNPMTPRRALLFAVFVAQLVAFFGWAMTVYLYFTEGVFAVMLFLLWYVNRGIIRHTVEESLTRQVIIEYGVFVALIAYIFYQSYQPR
jgi:hypothetical protein